MAFSPITDLVNWRLSSRIPRLQEMRDHPIAAQELVFRELMTQVALTDFGREQGVTGECT